MYYVGLDLHKKYITGCVLDSQGAVVAEQRRLPPVLETLLGWLAPVGQPRRPGVARDGGVATGGAPAGRSAGGFGGAPRCPDCRTRSGSAGARPGDSRGRAAPDHSRDRAVWGALAARRDRDDRPVWFESRAGGVCGAGAEHAELGREDGPWVGRPRGEWLAEVAVRRIGADAEESARPGAQPRPVVVTGQWVLEI